MKQRRQQFPADHHSDSTDLAPRMTQPEAMKTKNYVYGVEPLDGNNAWTLFQACAHGDLDKVEELLNRDERLVNAQYWYQFPIHLAVYAGHQKVVALLLKRGADPGQSRFTYNSWDKLQKVAQERGYAPIESMLQRAMQKRFRYDPDFESLKQAIISRDVRMVGSVLRRKPQLIFAGDALGNNAVHWSVITRQRALIERFAELGTPINALRADGQSPLLLAVNGAHDYWYREARGRAHPSLRNTSVLVGSLLACSAEYTISVAASIGDQERVDQLLKKDPGLARRRDTARVTPLTYAAAEGHLHIVKLLLEYGADPKMSEEGAPEGLALFEACRGNHFDVARLLLEHGANPNAGFDSSGCCLTIVEAYHGKQGLPLQKLLVEYGAITPPYAMSPAEIKRAIRTSDSVTKHEEFFEHLFQQQDRQLLELYLQQHPNVVKEVDCDSGVAALRPASLIQKFLKLGLNPNRTNWLGRTHLHDCAEAGDCETAKTFLDAGASINVREAEFLGTPLATAVRAGKIAEDGNRDEDESRILEMVEFLLGRGALLSFPDDQSWATPLAWARKRNLRKVEQVLVARGA